MKDYATATCTTEIEDALDAFELASGPEEVSRLIKHIDAQQAEIQRLNALLDNAPHEGPGGFSPGPLDAVVGRQTEE